MQPPQNQARCGSCGAPDDGERVYCSFCKNAISAALVQNAIPCTQCRTANRWGKQKCVQCAAWIVVACVFCGSISPHNQPACLQCHEAFAGAAQRKQAQMQAVQHQQHMQTAGVVGNVAASFLGAAVGAGAGAAITHSWFGNDVPHHHHSWGNDGSWTDNSSSYDNSQQYDNSQPQYDNSQSAGDNSSWSGSSGESDAGSAGDGGGFFGGDSGDSGGGGGDWGGGSSDGS